MMMQVVAATAAEAVTEDEAAKLYWTDFNHN